MLWQRSKTLAAFGGALVAVLAAGLLINPSAAATIPYPDQGPVPPGISFTNIFESSGTDPVPLYGPPTPFTTGLDTDPANFVSTASGGAEDATDGQLNYTVMSVNPLVAITAIDLFEAGDYTLTGVGTAATQALAGAIIRATVTQINGVDIAPLALTPVNTSVGFNLAANAGVVQPWSLGATLDVAAQLGANQRATKVEVVIANQLLSLSETGSLSLIAKRDSRVGIDTEVIPEPATLVLMLGGCLAMTAVARRRGN